jgi:hypothetical protein
VQLLKGIFLALGPTVVISVAMPIAVARAFAFLGGGSTKGIALGKA